MTHRKAVLIIVIGLGMLKMHAQQLPLYSMYMMNGFVFNPAVAGSDGYTTVGLSSRDHMVGFENSPKTYVLSLQGRILRRSYQIKHDPSGKAKKLTKRSGRVGLGAYIFNDRNGAVERTGGSITYAYHIYMQNTQFSLGVAASTFQFKLNQDQLSFKNPDPTSYNGAYANKMLVPDITFGAYLLNTTSFIGLSAANLFQTRIKIGPESYDYRMYRHYFLMGGKRFNQDDVIAWEPSFLLKATEKMVFQADLQMRAYYNQDYYLGICFRTGSAIGMLIGIKWNRINIGYAFDYSLTSIQRYSYGAHELNIALKLGDNARRYRWLIRY